MFSSDCVYMDSYYRQVKVAERYYWQGMTKDVAEYCSTSLFVKNETKFSRRQQISIQEEFLTKHLLNGGWTWWVHYQVSMSVI